MWLLCATRTAPTPFGFVLAFYMRYFSHIECLKPVLKDPQSPDLVNQFLPHPPEVGSDNVSLNRRAHPSLVRSLCVVSGVLSCLSGISGCSEVLARFRPLVFLFTTHPFFSLSFFFLSLVFLFRLTFDFVFHLAVALSISPVAAHFPETTDA